MTFGSPITMAHPKALIAGIGLARAIRGLEHMFGADLPFRALLERCDAFVVACDELVASEHTEDALRAAAARVNEAQAAMRECEPAFFELVWSRAIEESLGDPSGGTARRVMGTLLEMKGVKAEHISALWEVVTRPPRSGDVPRWKQVLAENPLPGFPRWLHRSVAMAAMDAATETPLEQVEELQGEAVDLDHALIRAMEQADLGEMEAQVLALSELAGLDSLEIADRLGKNRGAVDTALSRARKKIKEAM